jgi:uncharacterized ubiquitin-like protein YukD
MFFLYLVDKNDQLIESKYLDSLSNVVDVISESSYFNKRHINDLFIQNNNKGFLITKELSNIYKYIIIDGDAFKKL